ncbi:MAG: glucokinase [Candidatus Marinimicrobia bacterium]|nr:glucokinase [Candidatus Neomarinimicrobiota bacterium]
MKKRSTVLGIDIGGTNTVYGFVNNETEVCFSEQIPTHGSLPISDLLDRLQSGVAKFFDQNPHLELDGIGIGAPNGNYYTGMIQNPPNLSWGNVNIISEMNKRFGCKVKITNDANAAALGEKHYGIAKNMNDFIVITLGTGLGSGIFSSGRLLYGHDGFAGEMGHMPIKYGGRLCNCGNRGCLESYVSASGIRNTIREFLNQDPKNEFLIDVYGEKIDGGMLDDAFDSGNQIARKIYEYTGEKLGQGLAQAATLLSPEAFIFYGGFSNAGDRILKFAKESMNQNLINDHSERIRLLPSGLPQGKAGILGAASLILFD